MGIQHQVSCPYTPQQNGRVGRKNRQIVEVGLSLFIHSQSPQNLWPYAFYHAIQLVNLLPSKPLSFRWPTEILHKHQPDYSKFRTFGCSCFSLLRSYNKHKLEPRSKECIFLGLSAHHKGCICLDISGGKISVSRDVVFDEQSFPFKCCQPTTTHLDIQKSMHPNQFHITTSSFTPDNISSMVV